MLLERSWYEVGKSYLQGSPTAASAVDFIKFRRQAVDFFLEVELARQGFRLEDLQLVKQHLANVEIYRQTVTAKPDADGVVASQWQAGLKVSSIKALKLMEDCLKPLRLAHFWLIAQNRG